MVTMFLMMLLQIACHKENSLPIFSETSEIQIIPSAQIERVKEVFLATSNSWKQDDKNKAQLILQSYYVNEFVPMVPTLHQYDSLLVSTTQYNMGVTLIDIPIVQVPSKFEALMDARSSELESIFLLVPVAVDEQAKDQTEESPGD
jgi:hypothetical protein